MNTLSMLVTLVIVPMSLYPNERHAKLAATDAVLLQ